MPSFGFKGLVSNIRAASSASITSIKTVASVARCSLGYVLETAALPFTGPFDRYFPDDFSMPGAFMDTSATLKSGSAPGISLRELFVDAAREAICEMLANNTAGEGEPVGARFLAKEGAQRLQDELFSKSEAHDMERLFCKDINNETKRCRRETSKLDDALQTILNRVISVEMGQIKLEARVQEANAQREKDASTINELRTELTLARQSISSLERIATLSESRLNVIRMEHDEIKPLLSTVKRWIANEQEATRKAAQAEARRRKEAAEKAQREKAERARREKEEAERREKEKEARWWKDTQARWAREEQARIQRGWYQTAEEKRKEAILARWDQYTTRLGVDLTFKTIIWPVLVTPSKPEDFTLGDIREFVLSKYHSVGKQDKHRVREALLRWAEDKREAVRSRVLPQDRSLVDRAFHNINVHLNDLFKTCKS